MTEQDDDLTCHPPHFRVLTEKQVAQVHDAALRCLERTGVNVYNAEARALLVQAGARADNVRVRIPPHIIHEAVKNTPSTFSLWSRDALHEWPLCPGQVYFGPGPTCTYFIDPHTGERRQTRRGDAALTARVCDALKNIDFVMGLGLISDVNPRLAPVYEFAELVTHTTKPLLAWAYSEENLRDIYRIAAAVTGSEHTLRERPFFALFANAQAPLVHTSQDMANVFWAIERDIPIVYMGGGSAGVTAPITGAGLLVTFLAGALSSLAVVQLKKQGTRICIGGVPNSMDLLTGRPNYGGPEMSLYSSAMADIARYLCVPFMGTAGASEAKCLDLQAAIESSVQVILSGLSGAVMVHDVGFLDCADIGSLESLVMNDEIIAMTRRIMKGIEISEDTLMLDLIDEVGPGGAFIATSETARRCRKEIWSPSLFDRKPWVLWQAAGGKSLNDAVRARLHEILERHVPPPLPENVIQEIGSILREAEAREAQFELKVHEVNKWAISQDNCS